MKWQPIETAPKDGTHILAKFYGRGITETWWHVGKTPDGVVYAGEWKAITLIQHGCGCCSFENEPPTHWMPLPDPPEDT